VESQSSNLRQVATFMTHVVRKPAHLTTSASIPLTEPTVVQNSPFIS